MPGPHFEITRITVVRVRGAVGAHAVGQLERVCSDLVHDHGVTELLLDVSDADDVDRLLPALVETVDGWMSSTGGSLELRLPASPTDELIGLAAEVTAFAPVEPADTNEPRLD